MLLNHCLKFLFIVSLVPVVLAGCNQNLPVTGNEAENTLEVVGDPPKAVVDESVHDFGSMEVEQTLTHEFVIRNEGTGVLKLKKDRSTCKCTMAEFDEAEVAPGESTTIKLEWIGKTLDPAFSQAAYIKTNDPNIPELELRVTGRVDQVFDITPDGVWNLGEMNRKEATEFSGMISTRVYEQFNASEYECDNELVTVKFQPVSEEKKTELGIKSGVEISGAVAPGSPVGQFSEIIKIPVDVNGEQKFAVLTLKGFYSGPVQIIGPVGWMASDMLLVMGRFPASEGKKVNLSMFLRDNDGEPLEVVNIKCEPEFLKASLVKDEKFKAENRERYNLTIEVPPGAPSLVHEKDNPAKVTIETNNPMLEKMVINVNLISY